MDLDDPQNQDPEGGQPPAGKTFTEDEVNKLLSRERDKLHGRLSKVDEMQSQLAELQKAEADRQKEIAKQAKAAEAARKAAEEAELDAKALIERRSAEMQAENQKLQEQWANQVSTLQQQMLEREAVFTKERELAALQAYTQQAVAAKRDEIAPELVRYIDGNTPEEIDASIAQAIEATNSILSGIQRAQQQARAGMPGVSTGGFAPTGPLEGAATGQGFTDAQIQAMSPKEYAQNRAAIHAQQGIGNGGYGVGLLG